ncbi:MAG: HAMP domain-containing histidine kinase, partial [Proteobacteria bacterium]
ALQGAYNSLQRLDRLNTSLLLLARIENRQFANLDQVDLSALVTDKLHEFEGLLQEKEIQVAGTVKPATIRMNAALCQVLLNNLFSNALRYSPVKGQLRLSVEPGSLCFCNTAEGPPLNEQTLYQRFQRGNRTSESAGLGLALVKQICDVSGLVLSYSYSDKEHCFRVSWPDAPVKS